jgi:hypothetical protein
VLIIEVERTAEGVGVRQGVARMRIPASLRASVTFCRVTRCLDPLREPENRIKIQLPGYLISYSPGADFTIDGP